MANTHPAFALPARKQGQKPRLSLLPGTAPMFFKRHQSALNDLQHTITEQNGLLEAINQADQTVPLAVAQAIPQIEALVAVVVE